MNARAFYIALGVLFLDQASIYWRIHFYSSEVILNTHSAWWVSVLTLVVCLLVLSRRHAATSSLAITLLAAGGLSNLLDRALYHGVVDYLFISRLAFNLADIAIIVGAALLLYSFRT